MRMEFEIDRPSRETNVIGSEPNIWLSHRILILLRKTEIGQCICSYILLRQTRNNLILPLREGTIIYSFSLTSLWKPQFLGNNLNFRMQCDRLSLLETYFPVVITIIVVKHSIRPTSRTSRVSSDHFASLLIGSDGGQIEWLRRTMPMWASIDKIWNIPE
jgi:hypothetical protein